MGLSIFGRRKVGHYRQHGQVLQAVVGGEYVEDVREQVRRLLSSSDSILLLEGDGLQLLYLPLLAVRSLLVRSQVVLFVVRSEFIWGDRRWHAVKRLLFRTMKLHPRITTVAFHRPEEHPAVGTYFTTGIHDLQYWDLPYLDRRSEPVPELEATEFGDDRPLMLVPMTTGSGKRKCVDELHETLKRGSLDLLNIVVLGGDERFDALSAGNPRLVNVDRYVTDEELNHLMDVSDVFYCYFFDGYRRPSGYFGRATQLGKWALVRRGGYLDRTYGYGGKIAVGELEEMRDVPWTDLGEQPEATVRYDDVRRVRELLGRDGRAAGDRRDARAGSDARD